MSRRRRWRHEFLPVLTWDESAVVCRRCDQFAGGDRHDTRSWWRRKLRPL